MKDHGWELTRKFPFIKKRPLTQIEIIHRNYIELKNLIPTVYMVVGMAKVYYWCKNLIKAVSQ